MEKVDINQIYKKHGLNASSQRDAIYKYLCENYTHPTVDEIYNALKPCNKKLSRTTVYNNLKSLEKIGAIRSVNIEDLEVRYDAIQNDHGHFKCTKCNTLYDFEIDHAKIEELKLEGFVVQKTDVFLKGICQKCARETSV